MKMRHRMILSIVIALGALPVVAAGQSLPYPTDPQTRRAVGANELAAQELKQKLDAGEKVLLIDVREAPSYEKETIPGAIHISFANLQDALKDIPKDRTLVFT
jgi:3-mercaptopyruvate sulfurtransferase SseA